MDDPDKTRPGDDLTNAQMNRDQMILFLKKSLSRSQHFEYELTQTVKMLSACTVKLIREREEMTLKMVELYGELDDQDRELDELYGLKPDNRDF